MVTASRAGTAREGAGTRVNVPQQRERIEKLVGCMPERCLRTGALQLRDGGAPCKCSVAKMRPSLSLSGVWMWVWAGREEERGERAGTNGKQATFATALVYHDSAGPGHPAGEYH